MSLNHENIKKRRFFKEFQKTEILPSNLDYLVKKEVFIEENKYLFSEIEYYSDIEAVDFSHNSFSTYLNVNEKFYYINEEILEEIYNSYKFFVEEIEGVNEWKINEIYANVESCIDNEEKINYLKQKHKELYLEISNEPEYLIYTEKREFNGFNNWKELVFDLIRNDSEIVEEYLTTGNFQKFSNDIYRDWIKYYNIDVLTNICKEEILKINNSPSIKNIDLSFQISLLEEILNLKNWSEISATKKGELISNLLGKNKDNIKKVYLEFDKKNSEISKKLLDDRNEVSTLIKKLLG